MLHGLKRQTNTCNFTLDGQDLHTSEKVLQNPWSLIWVVCRILNIYFCFKENSKNLTNKKKKYGERKVNKHLQKRIEKALMHMKLKLVQKETLLHIKEKEREMETKLCLVSRRWRKKIQQIWKIFRPKPLTLADRKGKRILQRSTCEKLKINIT